MGRKYCMREINQWHLDYHVVQMFWGKKWIWFEIYTSKLYKIKIKLENGEYKDWGSGGHFISEWKRQACLFNMKALA